jgi:hypothetical protein
VSEQLETLDKKVEENSALKFEKYSKVEQRITWSSHLAGNLHSNIAVVKGASTSLMTMQCNISEKFKEKIDENK